VSAIGEERPRSASKSGERNRGLPIGAPEVDALSPLRWALAAALAPRLTSSSSPQNEAVLIEVPRGAGRDSNVSARQVDDHRHPHDGGNDGGRAVLSGQAGLAVSADDEPALDASASVRRWLERVDPPRRKRRGIERDVGVFKEALIVPFRLQTAPP
jgi:hypothetical protein